MMRWVVAALAMLALPLAAQTVSYDCEGVVSTENLFDGGPQQSSRERWRIVANPEAGYVKRAPELAAGCLQPAVEVCGCEQAPNVISCRSLGLTREGVEVGMDFSIDRNANRMKLAGRRYDPKSGSVIETRGELACEPGPR